MPGETQVGKEHPQFGCHLRSALLPPLQLVGLPGEEVRMETHLSRGRVAWGVRTHGKGTRALKCFKAEQRPECSQVGLAPFWAAEVEELLGGSLAGRPAQAL